MQFKENQGNVTKKDLTDTQAKKERIKIECPIKDCPFSTDYAPPELATIQNQNHWTTKHQDDFLAEEVKRKKDEQDAFLAIEAEKHEKTKEWWLELEALELQKQSKLEQIKRGELIVKIDKDGKKVEEQVTPEKNLAALGNSDQGGAPIKEMVEILGEFKKKIDNMEGIKQENETGMLSMIKTMVENQTNILKENGTAKTGKSILVKEAKFPKLSKGEKYQDWMKRI